jgi:hypothetical protein
MRQAALEILLTFLLTHQPTLYHHWRQVTKQTPYSKLQNRFTKLQNFSKIIFHETKPAILTVHTSWLPQTLITSTPTLSPPLSQRSMANQVTKTLQKIKDKLKANTATGKFLLHLNVYMSMTFKKHHFLVHWLFLNKPAHETGTQQNKTEMDRSN